MKKIILFAIIFPIFAYTENYDLTPIGIGKSKILQTYKEFKSYFKGYTFLKNTNDYNMIYAYKNGELQFSFNDKNDESQKDIVKYIRIYSSNIKTTNNVYVGMKVSELKAIYGNQLNIKHTDEGEFIFVPKNMQTGTNEYKSLISFIILFSHNNKNNVLNKYYKYDGKSYSIDEKGIINEMYNDGFISQINIYKWE